MDPSTQELGKWPIHHGIVSKTNASADRRLFFFPIGHESTVVFLKPSDIRPSRTRLFLWAMSSLVIHCVFSDRKCRSRMTQRGVRSRRSSDVEMTDNRSIFVSRSGECTPVRITFSQAPPSIILVEYYMSCPSTSVSLQQEIIAL
jgi:hypothetical protein